MNRADHFRAADEMLHRARRQIERVGPHALAEAVPELTLLLAAAQVHATLAAAGPGVEQEVRDQLARESAALGATEAFLPGDPEYAAARQREQQKARPPLPPVRVEETAGTVRPKPGPPKPERPPTSESGVSRGPDGAR